jgi:hypothetical protein
MLMTVFLIVSIVMWTTLLCMLSSNSIRLIMWKVMSFLMSAAAVVLLLDRFGYLAKHFS